MTAPEQTAHTGRDIPIIFSGPMVRALLDGRKTMTRRLAWQDIHYRMNGAIEVRCKRSEMTHSILGPSPWQRAKPGDRLWVRETWKPHSLYAGMKPRDVPTSKVFYAADGSYAPSNTPWVPSIYLPRWASRLTPTVTTTKIERLQDISEADAQAEGVSLETVGCSDGQSRALWFGLPHVGQHTARDAFATLWDSLHNPNGYCADDAPHGWAANPEVVVLTFTVHKQNIDAPSRSPAPPFAGRSR